MAMNAIILAAGLGSRFGSTMQHKALLPIFGVPNIERTIAYLHAAEITHIQIVTGHLHDQFTYLVKKYAVQLVYNEKYREYNNIYSFYKAIDYFNHSYVINADVVLFANPFFQPAASLYFTIQRQRSQKKECLPFMNAQGFVDRIVLSHDNQPSLLGISFWVEADCARIKKDLPSYLQDDYLKNLSAYWDLLPPALLGPHSIKAYCLDPNLADEIDDAQDYERVCQKQEGIRQIPWNGSVVS